MGGVWVVGGWRVGGGWASGGRWVGGEWAVGGRWVGQHFAVSTTIAKRTWAPQQCRHSKQKTFCERAINECDKPRRNVLMLPVGICISLCMNS